VNTLQLHKHLPNPARNLVGAGFWEKWPDFGSAGLPEPESKSGATVNITVNKSITPN